MADETKEKIKKELREDDFIFGDYFQSVNPSLKMNRKRTDCLSHSPSCIQITIPTSVLTSGSNSGTTQPQSVGPSGSTTQPQSVGPSGSTTQPQSVGPSGSTTQPQSVGPSKKTSKTQE